MTDDDLRIRIIELEERFRLAQMHSDLAALDELVSPDLYFTGLGGQIVRKEDDLAFHRAGTLRLSESTPYEQHIQVYPGVAVVSVLMHLVGTYQGNPIDQRMRYTRVWRVAPDGSIQVVAGHMSEVLSSPG